MHAQELKGLSNEDAEAALVARAIMESLKPGAGGLDESVTGDDTSSDGWSRVEKRGSGTAATGGDKDRNATTAKKDDSPRDPISGIKTSRICSRFRQTGRCSYGDKCSFVHGVWVCRVVRC